MFREMRRVKQQISMEECVEVLKTAPRGVLSVIGEDGYPYAFPMNHFYFEGKLYFHSAISGHKLDAILANNKVSFCAMDEGFRKDGEWSLNIKSVVLFGKICLLEEKEECLSMIRQLGIKHYPDEQSVDELINSSMKRVQMLVLTIDHMTGKLVNEA